MRNSFFVILAFALALSAVSGGRAASAGEAAVKKKELSRINREMREKKKEIARAKKKERSILTELDKIDRDIQAGKAELARQEVRLHESEASLQDIQKSTEEVNLNLVGLKQAYALRLRALYKISRNGYAATVFTAGGLGDALRRIKYLGIIVERDRMVMREYGSALDRLATRQVEISEKKEAILERRRTIDVRKTALESQKRKKASLLAGVRGKKSLYEETLHELEASSVSLWAMVKKAEQERNAVTAQPAPPKAERWAPGRTGLPWPAEGPVLTRFGMQRHPQFGTMVFRRGIEIEAREGEPVKAVSDGQVAYADWYKGYGKLVIIEHRPGFYTLYGNLSRLDLNKGDRVVKGQVIGLAGDTGSLKGSKLYFEIRQNGEAQDPLSWLAKK